ncbi:MAG TPA: tetraacyldisaccharide 4'-kinase [Gemmatimonadales bacterium]|nr:tetraacyldisaccharide 4'-kinase [Gemmatimonadales bacterium]
MIARDAGRRFIDWLWRDHGPVSAGVRLVLLPLAGLYALVMMLRTACYRLGLFDVRTLPLATVAVGNLSVGGAGKTPVAAWIAAWFVQAGRRPGILLRGYGGDEPLVHERLVPGAVVVADPDRVAGGARAQAAGAQVLVLDDAFQLLGVRRDVNIVLVSAENVRLSRWPLPAGPWREGWGALRRADAVVVTRKRVEFSEARALADRLGAERPGVPVAIAHLGISHFEGLRSGAPRSKLDLAGRRVIAAAGIADPTSYAVQVRSSGAIVQLVAYQDHHAYGARDIAALVQAAALADYVVVTEKDAVKLRTRWPNDVREPLVAVLSVRWERGGEAIERLLADLLAPARRRPTEPSTQAI